MLIVFIVDFQTLILISEEWQKKYNNSDHVIICWQLQNHIVCEQCFRLYKSRGIYYGILASFDGVFVIFCLYIIYGFIPPVICLPVLGVIDGSNDGVSDHYS